MRKGFTLIELSIVIVIIGLLTSAVIGAASLIRAANVQSTISSIRSLNQSVLAFKLEYDALPGDFIEASSYFVSGTQPDQVTDGNGDKTINGMRFGTAGVYNSSTGCNNSNYRITNVSVSDSRGWIPPDACSNGYYAAEWLSALDHLAAAEVVKWGVFDETSTTVVAGESFPRVQLPANKRNGLVGGIAFGFVPSSSSSTPYMSSGHKITLGLCGTEQGTNAYKHQCGLNAWDIRKIDEKIDDGKPFSGKMVNIGYNNDYRTAYVWGINHNGNETRGCGTGPEDLGGTNSYQPEQYWDTLDSNRRTICAPYIEAEF